MRIAISGSHVVGKTSLAEALADALPGYEWVPEPYYLLEEDGHAFADVPSIEDFEAQLERSLQCVTESEANVIFDRCPLDMLGYLITHRDADTFRIADWMTRVEESMDAIDVVVFVPIEVPDRIPVSRSDAGLRADVDAVLRDMIVDDAYGLGIDVVEVSGSVAERVREVLARVD